MLREPHVLHTSETIIRGWVTLQQGRSQGDAHYIVALLNEDFLVAQARR